MAYASRTPDHLRLESGDSVKIRDGDSWWTYHPLLGVYSNEEDPALSEDIGSEALLILDPSPLIKESRFKVLGREMIAGREAIRLRGEGRHGVLTSRLGEDPRLALAAQSLEYAVDVERGLLLREAKLFEDRPVWCREIIEIEFDEDLPRDTLSRYEARAASPSRFRRRRT